MDHHLSLLQKAMKLARSRAQGLWKTKADLNKLAHILVYIVSAVLFGPMRALVGEFGNKAGKHSSESYRALKTYNVAGLTHNALISSLPETSRFLQDSRARLKDPTQLSSNSPWWRTSIQEGLQRRIGEKDQTEAPSHQARQPRHRQT